MNTTDLTKFDNSDFQIGRSKFVVLIWFIVNVIFFKSYLFPFSSFKRSLLRLFGAKIGKAVVLKPNINIKYPWKLSIGEFSWIGEAVWIDNLAEVKIGSNCCISQGAMLLCGNHNYKKSSFDLIIGKIFLEDGAWIGAKAVVCPSVIVKSHALLTVGSVATSNLEAYKIYQGNPAALIKERIIN